MKKNAIEDIIAKLVELTNDLQRTRADFENYRKQVELQKENEKKAVKFATFVSMSPDPFYTPKQNAIYVPAWSLIARVLSESAVPSW